MLILTIYLIDVLLVSSFVHTGKKVETKYKTRNDIKMNLSVVLINWLLRRIILYIKRVHNCVSIQRSFDNVLYYTPLKLLLMRLVWLDLWLFTYRILNTDVLQTCELYNIFYKNVTFKHSIDELRRLI